MFKMPFEKIVGRKRVVNIQEVKPVKTHACVNICIPRELMRIHIVQRSIVQECAAAQAEGRMPEQPQVYPLVVNAEGEYIEIHVQSSQRQSLPVKDLKRRPGRSQPLAFIGK